MPLRMRLRLTVSCRTTLRAGSGIGKPVRNDPALRHAPLPTLPARLIHSQRLELAMQRRALHADELCGPGYVAAETADLGAQVFALEGFAGIPQRHAHQVLAA